MSETAEAMAQRLTRLAQELKACGRDADAAAALAGTLAIYLDQHRAALDSSRRIDLVTK